MNSEYKIGKEVTQMVLVSATTNTIQDIWDPGDDSTRVPSDYRD